MKLTNNDLNYSKRVFLTPKLPEISDWPINSSVKCDIFIKIHMIVEQDIKLNVWRDVYFQHTSPKIFY